MKDRDGVRNRPCETQVYENLGDFRKSASTTSSIHTLSLPCLSLHYAMDSEMICALLSTL